MNILRKLSGQVISYSIFATIRSSRIQSSFIFAKDLGTMHTKPARPLVFCGPSGSGKSTLVKRLMDDFPDQFGFIISHTTRNPRPGEVHGQHYYFTDENAMKLAIEKGEFVEHAIFSENMYGTSFKAMNDISQYGMVPVLDIDMQGMIQVKRTQLNPWCVFIQPPSMVELRKRLLQRKTETEETLERRLGKAREEMMYGMTAGNFDKVIVNDDLDKAFRELKKFVVEEILANTIPIN